jgi:methionyl-tRNA synthetase
MPGKAADLRQQLGLDPLLPGEERDVWPSVFGGLTPGTLTRPGPPLFPRFDKDQAQAALSRLGVQPKAADANKPKAAASGAKRDKRDNVDKTAAEPTPSAPGNDAVVTGIAYEDFSKVELRVAAILSAERVPKSDKLLKLSVDAGDPAPRQIIAGIGQHHEPETLIGKRVIIVANLKPRKLMGLESQGMVLAASDADGLYLTSIAGDPKPGSVVK